jgi:hypothetical protein
MVRPIITAIVVLATLGLDAASAQQTVTFKNFQRFERIVTGIDFFASGRQQIAPFEKPVAEAKARLETLLGGPLPKGALFICSSIDQKDSIYEPKILKAGYSWVVTAMTAEARAQEMLARIKAQMGREVSAEMLDRMKNRSTEMSASMKEQLVSSTLQQISYAVLQTMLAKDLQYRSSRLDDMGKSPLPDWLDIGIASYAAGINVNASYLQQHLDETFPIEDILSMARPFVASSSDQIGGGGGAFMARSGGNDGGGPPSGFPGASQASFGGRGMGGFGGGGGQRGSAQRNMPKDEQDRMLFDSQASTFFSYLVQKIGIEKIKELIAQAREGKESREYITLPEVLGPDFEKIEEDWANWVKALKP